LTRPKATATVDQLARAVVEQNLFGVDLTSRPSKSPSSTFGFGSWPREDSIWLKLHDRQW